MKFKFELGEKVFVLGRQGICVVCGRGIMEYLSGGIANHYVISGAHRGVLYEFELMNIDEGRELYEKK
jgi:hypothetical protein